MAIIQIGLCYKSATAFVALLGQVWQNGGDGFWGWSVLTQDDLLEVIESAARTGATELDLSGQGFGWVGMVEGSTPEPLRGGESFREIT